MCVLTTLLLMLKCYFENSEKVAEVTLSVQTGLVSVSVSGTVLEVYRSVVSDCCFALTISSFSSGGAVCSMFTSGQELP